MWMREKRMSQANVQPDGVRGGVDGRHALVLRLEGDQGAISKTKHKLAHTRTVAAPEITSINHTRGKPSNAYLAVDAVDDVAPRVLVHRMRGPMQRIVVANGCRRGQAFKQRENDFKCIPLITLKSAVSRSEHVYRMRSASHPNLRSRRQDRSRATTW